MVIENKKYLKPCYRCNGSGKRWKVRCLECLGDGWVTKRFWKEQIIQFADNNLVAIAKIHKKEKDNG